ncbi:hypothetical protein MPTK1_3g13730 [Marchantia polymorpha subsp. ruderalis]|uniref:Protein kinase domain-containing protein n=2 Tax=Marchantia polymorpha TaxID=3197 RepID=A0AAF6B0H6_MARPO|nr:hypothetical protein MARPO_0004s0298 [Marchantia polymorpha]BBN05510.1 hypothetical protein Mp_3g13730 [Marchantia polymorpha subsp. ruderalis]|eukprot:PTQ49075.1 hypothetical protein MARPO_0004s0298 [Marchantia polymorpha]
MAGHLCCWSSDVSNPGAKDLSRTQHQTPKTFSLDELRRATKSFSSSNVVGKGVHGTVYKGKLRDGQGAPFLVAVKRYSGDFSKEFQVELNALSRLHHLNIIRCLGSCIQKDEKLLVLEHAYHGSLYSYLHSQKPILSWTEKLSIALGIVEGLKYLRAANIIHRNPNSSNILLDKSLVPKIAGFSLSLKAYKVKEEEGLHISFLGTQGYTDPDYRSQGAMSTTVDIYIFGVVLMELITGKPPVAPVTDTLLVTEMHQKQASGSNFSDLAEPNGVVSPLLTSSIKIAMELALRCTQADARERPRLNEILCSLEEALRLQTRE